MTYWNQVAQDFDNLYDPSRRFIYAMNQVLRRGLFQRAELSCDLIRQLGRPSVLDVGCGSGRNIIEFLQSGAREVTGIDSATAMLEIAGRVTRPFGGRVGLLEGDFLPMQIAETYDVVVALGVFDYLHEDALPFLVKMRSLADRVVVWSAPGRSLLRMPLRAWRYRRSGVAVHFYRRREVAEICQRAGFPSFSIRPLRSSGYLVIGWNS